MSAKAIQEENVSKGVSGLKWAGLFIGIVAVACCIVGGAMYSSGAFKRKKRSGPALSTKEHTVDAKPSAPTFHPLPQQPWPQEWSKWQQQWAPQQWAQWPQDWSQWQQDWQWRQPWPQWGNNSYVPPWDPRQIYQYQAPPTPTSQTPNEQTQQVRGRLPDLNSFELSSRPPGTGIIPGAPSSKPPSPPSTPLAGQNGNQTQGAPPVTAANTSFGQVYSAAEASSFQMQGWGYQTVPTQAACANNQGWVPVPAQAASPVFSTPQSLTPPTTPSAQARVTSTEPIAIDMASILKTQSLQPPTQAAIVSYQQAMATRQGTQSFNH